MMDPSHIYTDLESYDKLMSSTGQTQQRAKPPDAPVTQKNSSTKSRIYLISNGVLMGLVLISMALNIWLVLNFGKCQDSSRETIDVSGASVTASIPGSHNTTRSTELVTCPGCPPLITCTECRPAPTCSSCPSCPSCPHCPTCPPCISEPLCPTGFPLLRPGTNSCYRWESSASWSQAAERCQLYGAYLVAVETEEEDAWLFKVAAASRFWLGATDSEEKGKWVWIGTGQPVNYTNWDAPSFYRPSSSHHHLIRYSTDGWRVYSSTSSSPFFCEIRAIE